MKTISKVLMSLAAVAAIGIGAATAATNPTKKSTEVKADRMIKRLDLNKDGAVSVDEAMKRATDRFAKADLDKDGKVTKAEIDKVMAGKSEEKRAKLLKRYDKDGDGVITTAEVQAKIEKRLGKLDGDKDGKVTKAEFLAFKDAKAAKKAEKKG
jgi:Ca2+-binding EF-hand superfamily protein